MLVLLGSEGKQRHAKFRKGRILKISQRILKLSIEFDLQNYHFPVCFAVSSLAVQFINTLFCGRFPRDSWQKVKLNGKNGISESSPNSVLRGNSKTLGQTAVRLQFNKYN